VLLCCGKIYYELEELRSRMERPDVAIVRVEQLHPFPADELAAALAPYADDTPVFWLQEEPENMGAWRYLRHRCGERLFDRFPLQGITRPASASPATGSKTSHTMEQSDLFAKAFGQRRG
jgi:2-oxoglutarate dehydrogenase E1 component